jgi:hypothetical protein
MDNVTENLRVAARSTSIPEAQRGFPLGLRRLTLRNRQVAGWLYCLSDFSLWFSLPLSIWLSTGWVGLIFQWHSIARTACHVESSAGD